VTHLTTLYGKHYMKHLFINCTDWQWT